MQESENLPKDGDNPLATPSSKVVDPSSRGGQFSPLAIADCRRQVAVEMAKLAVAADELRADMEKAVAEQNFLKAAEIKSQTESKMKIRGTLETALQTFPNDFEKLNQVLQELGTSPKSCLRTPLTPKNERKRSLETPSSSDLESPGAKVTKVISKKLTPKQEQKRAEALQRKLEKEKQRKEKEKQKEEVKLSKELERRKKEEMRKIKGEQKELERKKKEAEHKRKMEERQKAMEEKEKKLEEKRKMIQEREKRQEERRLQQEAERIKKERTAKSFESFFIRKDVPKLDNTTLDIATANRRESQVFNNFRIKKDMRLAPISRAELINRADFDRLICSGTDTLYLQEIRQPSYKIKRGSHTWPVAELRKYSNNIDDDEVEVVDEDDSDEVDNFLDSCNKVVVEGSDVAPVGRIRAKLLQFCENERPPYFGTWSKQLENVGPRKPFGKDEKVLNYDYDSDEDWEEEEQGESLSDEEKDKEEEDAENDDEEDEDDGFFVAHGVLSKDEIIHDDEEEDDCSGGGENTRFDEELEEKKQKLRAEQFEEEYKKSKKMVKLKPRVYGCMWVKERRKDSVVFEHLLKVLQPYKAVPIAWKSCAETPSQQINTSKSNTPTHTPKRPRKPEVKATSGKKLHQESIQDLIMNMKKKDSQQ